MRAFAAVPDAANVAQHRATAVGSPPAAASALKQSSSWPSAQLQVASL
jgi:hypothetical protein